MMVLRLPTGSSQGSRDVATSAGSPGALPARDTALPPPGPQGHTAAFALFSIKVQLILHFPGSLVSAAKHKKSGAGQIWLLEPETRMARRLEGGAPGLQRTAGRGRATARLPCGTWLMQPQPTAARLASQPRTHVWEPRARIGSLKEANWPDGGTEGLRHRRGTHTEGRPHEAQPALPPLLCPGFCWATPGVIVTPVGGETEKAPTCWFTPLMLAAAGAGPG